MVFAIHYGFRLCESLVHNANYTIANELSKKVKILCAVLKTDIYNNRLAAVKDTWGKRCNKLIFLTPDNGCIQIETNILYCGLNKNEWKMAEDQYYSSLIYDRYPTNFEWYLLINSEGYIIAENMRYMLADYDPDSDLYFMSNMSNTEMTEDRRDVRGLKLIFSRKALETYVHADLDKQCTRGNESFHDREICFSAIGLTAIDSRDSWGRDRVLPANPYIRVHPPGHKNFWFCDRYTSSDSSLVDDKTYDCFSDFAVSFDYATTDLVYVLDFLIYQLRPYGVNYRFDLPEMLGGNTSAATK